MSICRLHGPPSGPVLLPSTTDMTTGSGPPLDGGGERSGGKNEVKNIREKNRMRKLRELYKFLGKLFRWEKQYGGSSKQKSKAQVLKDAIRYIEILEEKILEIDKEQLDAARYNFVRKSKAEPVEPPDFENSSDLVPQYDQTYPPKAPLVVPVNHHSFSNYQSYRGFEPSAIAHPLPLPPDQSHLGYYMPTHQQLLFILPDIPHNPRTMILVPLLAVLVATQATNIICPPGVTVFSAHDDSQYYSCPVVGQVAVLESCQPGEVFDRVSEMCGGLEKRSMAKDIINRPVIGEDVRLGTLFDARRGFLYSGFELYTRENLKSRAQVREEEGKDQVLKDAIRYIEILEEKILEIDKEQLDAARYNFVRKSKAEPVEPPDFENSSDLVPQYDQTYPPKAPLVVPVNHHSFSNYQSYRGFEPSAIAHPLPLPPDQSHLGYYMPTHQQLLFILPDIPHNPRTMILVPLLAVLVATQATNIICPPGVTVFSAHDDSQYYSCPVVGQVAVLESCQPGEVFDRVSEMCGGLEKRSMAKDIINRPVIGEDVRLGTLFDARRGFLYSGFELYTRENLKSRAQVREEEGSKSEVFAENTSHERMLHFGLGADLELDFLGGIIQAKGSAQVLSDDKRSDNYVRVIMKSDTVTRTESLDIDPGSVDFDYCDMVKATSGPTHVVTSVVYGQRANFVFEKKAESIYMFDEIEGNLTASVGLMGLLKVSGNVTIHANGSVYLNDEQIQVRFYGDTFLEKVPTTWLQAVETYNVALKAINQSVPVRFSLTSIKNYCEDKGVSPIVRGITTSLTNTAITVLRELEESRLRVAGLLESDAAIRYAAIKQQIDVFSRALDEYRLAYTSYLTHMLPMIKAGVANESELVQHVSDYRSSPFERARVKSFLDYREREVIAVTRIVADALTRDDMELADPVTATDNACVFKRQYATVFKLNILPESQNAENFLANTGGDWNEDDSWINSDYELYRIGQQKQAFEKYVDTNLADPFSGPRCYLVTLDMLNNDRKFEMQLFKGGRQITNSFTPPKRAPKSLKCQERYALGLELEVTASTNPDVTGIRVIASSVTGQGVVRELPNADRVTVTGLEPGTVYELTAEYMVQDEHGVSPKTAPIHCSTRVISAPSTITVTKTTTNSIALSWSKPETIALALKDTSISYEVSVKGQVSKKLITNGLSMNISGLPAGSLYDVSIVAKLLQPSLTDPRSSPAKLAAITAPAAPTAPKVREVKNNMAILEVDMGSVSLPKGASKDYLSVKYHQMDGKSGEKIAGTQTSFIQRVWSLLRYPFPQVGGSTDVFLGDLVKGTYYEATVRVLVRYDKTIVASPYSDPIAITTTSTETAFEKLRSGVETLKSDVNERCTSLEGSVEHLKEEMGRLVNKIANPSDISKIEDASTAFFTSVGMSTSVARSNVCRLDGMELRGNSGGLGFMCKTRFTLSLFRWEKQYGGSSKQKSKAQVLKDAIRYIEILEEKLLEIDKEQLDAARYNFVRKSKAEPVEPPDFVSENSSDLVPQYDQPYPPKAPLVVPVNHQSFSNYQSYRAFEPSAIAHPLPLPPDQSHLGYYVNPDPYNGWPAVDSSWPLGPDMPRAYGMLPCFYLTNKKQDVMLVNGPDKCCNSCKGPGSGPRELPEVFDRVSETCVGLEKRSVAKDIINRPVIGEDVRLGTLFDARRGFLYSGFELYTRENLKSRAEVREEEGSKSEVFAENTSHERMLHFGLGAELELDFLGGIIQAKGSAQVLSDDKRSDNYVRVVMKSDTVTRTESLDIDPGSVDFDYCDMVKATSGPTHVVTSVVYGQRANFVFEKKAESIYMFDEIEGNLTASVGLMGLLKVSGNVTIHANGSVYLNDEKIQVRFYGDTFLEKVPTTWLQAVETYNVALKAINQSVPVRFSLTSIKNYCDDKGVSPIVRGITTSLTNTAITVLRELEESRLRVAGLLESDAAIRYAAIKQQIDVFSRALDEYRLSYTSYLTTMLPMIKAGVANESELVKHVSDYRSSPFERARVKSFLDYREREVIAVTRIVADALTRNDMELADPVTATDNACVFKRQYATVFKLNILPESQNAENFLANTGGDWNEDDSWINSDYELYRIGQQKQAFEKYVDTNLADPFSSPRCYLVTLDMLNNDRKFEMQLFKGGRQITNSFIPPKRAPKSLKCQERHALGLDLVVTVSTNPDVTGIRVIASSVTGQGVVRELPNADRVTVTGLEPGTVYELTAEYMVQDEHGVSPKTAPIHCSTRVISAPSTITVTKTTANSIALSWSKPETIAPALKGYFHFIRGLPAGSLYDVSIVAKLLQPSLTDPRSSPAKLAAITAPAAPTAPKVKKVTNNMATLEVDMSGVPVPKGASKDYLSVKYHQVDGKSGEMIAGTQTSFIQRVWVGGSTDVFLGDLVKGTNYEATVRVLVRYDKTIVASPYSDPIAITTTSTETAFEKLRSGVETLKSDVNERCTTLEGSVEDLKGERDRLVNKVTDADPSDISKIEDASTAFFSAVGMSTSGGRKLHPPLGVVSVWWRLKLLHMYCPCMCSGTYGKWSGPPR
eukprot:sb/3460454/